MRIISFVAALLLVVLCGTSPVRAEMPAVPAGAVSAEALPSYPKPERVTVGAHINDILALDLYNHSYRLDLYVWFRWQNPAFRPWESAEFMNAFDPADHVRTPLYDEPQVMPDGTLYMVIRQQGIFSSKLPLQSYPFDKQNLTVAMEDSVYGTADLIYVPDSFENRPLTINERISLPGFAIGRPHLAISDFSYPTLFGDLRETEAGDYARADFIIPIARPWLATGIKVFMPVILIILCTTLVFRVHPAYVEGRLGVAITALLTLVALQLTTSSGLPEASYMLLTDKVYILCYLFIIATLMQVVRTSSAVHRGDTQSAQKSDRNALILLLSLLVLGMVFVFRTSF